MCGFGAILHKFVGEMKQLGDDGFKFMGKQVFVSLVQVAGDNLALNRLLSFVESQYPFSAQCAMLHKITYKIYVPWNRIQIAIWIWSSEWSFIAF